MTVVIRFRCHRYRSSGCKAILVFKKGEFTLIGDHAEFHQADEAFIANLKHENTVKERCVEEPIAIKDLFDQESIK